MARPDSMRIGITGVTGLIGGAIARRAQRAGHSVVGYSRSPDREIAHADEVRAFRGDGGIDLSDLDAIVHLAGEPIPGWWTVKKKRQIRESRVVSTRGIAKRLREMEAPPRVFLCGSATGFYGDRGSERLTEDAPAGDGFLASVCQQWEAAAREAQVAVRVQHLRTGMVLSAEGGAAPLMGRAFRLCLGGRLGDGRQYLPWIHLDDLAGLAMKAVEHERLTGAVNGVAPDAVTNREFTRTLADVLHRPAFIPAPKPLVKTVLGDFSELLLHSQRVVPHVAKADLGFEFAFPDLKKALQAVFR